MRLSRLLLLFVAAACGALAASAWLARTWLEREWALYRVAAAAPADAQRELTWFEQGPDAPERLRHLTARWGAGHPRFDLVVAQYVSQNACSDALREALSREFAWRPELLPHWARFWSWRAASPDEELASVTGYFHLLSAAERPRTIRWREVLDLQAALTLLGQERLAQRLTPENWAPRFRQWWPQRPQPFPPVARPQQPFD